MFFNKKLQKELEETKQLLRQKEERIKVLENECEFLFNNLSKKKRELIDADKKAQ